MTKTLGTRSNASFILAHVRQYSYVNKWSRLWMYQSSPGRYRTARDRKELIRYEYCIDEAIANLPEGWTYLGSGWSRDAFLGPDGVVYKVTRRCSDGSPNASARQCSLREIGYYQKHAEKAKRFGYRLAACRLLNNSVVAMEYVKKAKSLTWTEFSEVSGKMGLSDLHDDNVWRDENGVITFIDYAA